MFRALAHALLVTLSLLASSPIAAQDDTRADEGDERDADEEGVDRHPTAGRLSVAARLGYTTRMGSTPSVDPFNVFPAEDDPFAADGPFTARDFQAALRKEAKRLPDTNPFGTRIGVRGGYTLAEDLLYFGAALHYYMGDEEVGILLDGRQSSTKLSVVTAGLELGVDADVGAGLVIRPVIGFGASIGMSDVCVAGVCESGNQMQFYLNPGLALVGFVTDDVFVGAELALIGLTGPGRATGFDAMVTGGMAL